MKLKVDLIAEIGWNHMGDMEIAKSMVENAALNGASVAKFQTWSVSRLKEGEWDKDGRRQIYEKAELTKEKHEVLIAYCKQLNIRFLSSCFSKEDAQLLTELGQLEVKVPSFEVRNLELIQFCLDNFNHVIISTGTADLGDIIQLSKLTKGYNVTIMHCVSAYPCLHSEANLPRIKLLKEYFNTVGYSDHVPGIAASVISLEYGPTLIEKHFTTDHSLPGRDNKFAILPSELKELSSIISLRNECNHSHGMNYRPCEDSSRHFYSGRFNNA